MNEQSYFDLIDQGEAQAKQGNLQRAILYCEKAAALAHTARDDDSEMDALNRLSINAYNVGDYQKSIESSTRLLACTQQTRDEQYRLQATFNLAATLVKLDLQGRWRELKPLLLEGRQIARSLTNQYHEICHLVWLGFCASRVGEEEQGFAWLQEALSLIQPETEKRTYLRGIVYESFAEVMYRRGMYTEAMRYAEMAVDSFREYGYPELVANAQLSLAKVERDQGEKVRALQGIEEVLLLARQKGWKHTEQQAEYLRGELERELGHLAEAEEAARQALKLACEMKRKEEEVKCLLSLGRVLLVCNHREEGREMLKQARRLSQERDYQDYFEQAETLLRGDM